MTYRQNNYCREFYSRRFLFREILNAAVRCDDKEFAKFQLDAVTSHIKGFNAIGIIASVQRFDDSLQFEASKFHACFNVPPGGKMQAKKLRSRDLVEDRALRLPGTAIFNSDIMALDDWLDTEIYHTVKRPVGVHHSASLMYEMPLRRDVRFRITYFSSFSKTFETTVGSGQIEYFSFPLYLGWLHRRGVVDRETLSLWFDLLAGMTPDRLLLLREMVNIGRYQSIAVARRTKWCELAVRRQIANAYDAVRHLLPAPEFPDIDQSEIVDLVRLYNFLQLAGRPMSKIEPIPKVKATIPGRHSRISGSDSPN